MRALDLFCGGGGVCEGLMEAGYDVTGIDINPHCGKYYPGTFLRGDVLSVQPSDLDGYDLIWASPPCQAWSRAALTKRRRDNPRLIDFTRGLLSAHPWTCIENVCEAPIRRDLILTGPMVGLYRIHRARKFELSFFTMQPGSLRSQDREEGVVITKSLSHPYHYYRRVKRGLPGRLPVAEAMAVMGIRHRMTGEMVGEAVPPAMAAWIGRAALDAGLGARTDRPGRKVHKEERNSAGDQYLACCPDAIPHVLRSTEGWARSADWDDVTCQWCRPIPYRKEDFAEESAP